MKSPSTLFLKDFYKVGHVDQYPPGTSLVFSNFTARRSMLAKQEVVWFGLEYFIQKYLNNWVVDIRNNVRNGDISLYCEIMQQCLGGVSGLAYHLQDLELYIRAYAKLPLDIYALPERTVVPCGVPALVMYNTMPEFFWLPNMLETILSCTLWGPCTSATIAREYRLLLDEYAHRTSDMPDFVDWQAHDFSMRGMWGSEAAGLSAAAHLLYFRGTDSIPGILLQHEYYDAPFNIGGSVPATEHSVMCAYGKDNELETYRRLITEVYPSGIVSIVSDTWDLWNVIGSILPALKDEIMARDGKVVIRPDSGDPVKILCGADELEDAVEARYLTSGTIKATWDESKSEYKGVVELLWDIFGGTINSKGYKQLDPHIGVIYGDSITLARCKEICQRLEAKGFASTNVVFGIGSYAYQYVTRDTLGWAMKTTYIEIEDEGREIFKDPATDNGTKRSHRGLLRVVEDEDGSIKCEQQITWEQFYSPQNLLQRVYEGT